MAHSTHSRAIMAELGGKHLQDHKLEHESPASIHKGAQRSSSSTDPAPKSTGHTGGRGDDQAATEEATNEDDDEDSSIAQDEQEDEDEEPDTVAPFHGRGKGKGKGMRPAIRIEPVDEVESQDDSASHETGLDVSKDPVNSLLMGNKKRTYSSLSNTSVLFGDDESDNTFPRRKFARKLSNSSFKPLLKYKENANGDMNDMENAIETDDEDYSGVNLVPEDDDSEIEDIEKQEESFIIQDEEQSTAALINQFTDARRLSLESLASEDIFDFTAPLDDSFGMNNSDMGFARFFEPAPIPASPDVAAKRKFSDSSTKRVRFDDEVQMSDSSSSSSDELDSSLYPDLFLDQDKIPASLSQLLDYDHDEDNGDYDSPASEASFWDFGHDDLHQSTQGTEDFDESSDPGSSGYETDLGDTTDEYESDSDAPPQTPLQKKSVLRQPSSAPGSRFNSPKAFERSSRPTGRAIPPTRGIFIHEDFSKAIAVTNRTTKRLTFYRPRVPTMISWAPLNGVQSSSTSNANDSPRASLAQFNASDSEVSNEVFSNPFTASDIMLTGIFGSAPNNDYFFGTDSIGPPEAFYPFVSIGANGAVMDDDDEFEDEDYEDDLNITDFMDFGSDVDATDVEQEDDETDVPATPAVSTMAMNGSTPAQPTPMIDTPIGRKRSTSDAMLQHFDRGVVNSFRNNQMRYRDIAQLPSDPTIRASVSRPVRSGKSAETVMTPLRKRTSAKRAAKSPFQASSPMVHASSPLSGVTKASSRLNNSLMDPPRAPRMGAFT
ncbi:hypothetical protein BU23DRAFT_230291 [Bimuria novae-zelandiae CBS 107.79]|uniref:Uncharacterized protein n=1 Tax=Bimuria novae-zelandiae CBS 107.79 TaxID=1447943 RepID=A0A6A5VQ28_9PLEO|nr:hypothetical protein BU23DRAFT_230291 [Bimuria novae-zelandiae CBS 107.79]